MQTCIWPSWCHCHSLSLASVKSRLVLPFWYWLTRVVLEKGPLNGCVCVCFLKNSKMICVKCICKVQKSTNAQLWFTKPASCLHGDVSNCNTKKLQTENTMSEIQADLLGAPEFTYIITINSKQRNCNICCTDATVPNHRYSVYLTTCYEYLATLSHNDYDTPALLKLLARVCRDTVQHTVKMARYAPPANRKNDKVTVTSTKSR